MSSCANSTEKNYCILSSGITPDLGTDANGCCVDPDNCPEYVDRGDVSEDGMEGEE